MDEHVQNGGDERNSERDEASSGETRGGRQRTTSESTANRNGRRTERSTSGTVTPTQRRPDVRITPLAQWRQLNADLARLGHSAEYSVRDGVQRTDSLLERYVLPRNGAELPLPELDAPPCAEETASAGQFTRADDPRSYISGGIEMEDYSLGTRVCSVTTEDVLCSPVDFQGIPWKHIAQTRSMQRRQRVTFCVSYESNENDHDAIYQSCQPFQHHPFGKFQFHRTFFGTIKFWIPHFQLRHLLHTMNEKIVVTLCRRRIIAIDSSTQRIIFSQSIEEMENENVPISVTTLSVLGQYILVGGACGTLSAFDVVNRQKKWEITVSPENNASLNMIHVPISPYNAWNPFRPIPSWFLSCCNDQNVRQHDTETLKEVFSLPLTWAPNACSYDPHCGLISIVGDTTSTCLLDPKSQEIVQRVDGNHDFGFSVSWHPGGYVFATGNQDRTCTVWDVRMMKKITSLFCAMGGPRSVTFHPTGKYLAAACGSDIIHVFDTDTYRNSQDIDFFGDVGGVAFTPSGESMFFNVRESSYSSLVEFHRKDQGECLPLL